MAQSEIQFLLKLLLEGRLHAGTKRLVLERIGEVEAGLKPAPSIQQPTVTPYIAPVQAPSTQAILAANPAPVVQNALADRQAIIQQAMSGKTVPGEAGPRKMRGNAP